MIPLEEARKFISLDDKVKARTILAKLALSEPQNFQAWFLLAMILDDRAQAAYCHARGQAALESLLQSQSGAKGPSLKDHKKNSASLPKRKRTADAHPSPAPLDAKLRSRLLFRSIPPPEALSQPGNNSAVSTAARKCPDCAATIPADALVCGFCERESFFPMESAPETEEDEELEDTTTELPGKPGNRRRFNGLKIFMAIVGGALAVVILMFGWSRMADAESQSTHEVRYEVAGSAAGMIHIAYANSNGKLEYGNYSLPFSKGVMVERGVSVQISASYADFGLPAQTLSCRIWVDGVLRKEAEMSGNSAFITCVYDLSND